ncbi:MAG: nucleotidyltransferase family protein [Porticoccaceae bacterium]
MNVLTRVLRAPDELARLDDKGFFDLKVQADAAGLLGRVWHLAQRQGVPLPGYAGWHFSGAFKLAARQQAQAIREIRELAALFDWLGVDWVLLKGAAYIALDLPVAQGRTFADIDILVPREQLSMVERHLHMRHWLRTEIDDYDDRYYRQWMHEIPPLRHQQRGTVLDVHHNILPLTNRDVPDIGRFDVQVCPHRQLGTVRALSDVDLCIHAAVHLFSESEYHNGLRDLSDLDLLLRHFSAGDGDFVARLRERAALHGLERYTDLALIACGDVLKTPLPSEGGVPRRATRGQKVLAAAYRRIFTPAHSRCRPPGHGLAAFLLYCRGHLIRMPLRLLVPHLLRKAVMRAFDGLRAKELSRDGL